MKQLKVMFPAVYGIPGNFGGTPDNSILNTVRYLTSDNNIDLGSRQFMRNLINSND